MSYPLVCLGDVADFINGVAFKPEDWGTEGKPIIRIQNLITIQNVKLKILTSHIKVIY